MKEWGRLCTCTGWGRPGPSCIKTADNVKDSDFFPESQEANESLTGKENVFCLALFTQPRLLQSSFWMLAQKASQLSYCRGDGVKAFTTDSLAIWKLWHHGWYGQWNSWQEILSLRIGCGRSPMSGGRVQMWSRDQWNLFWVCSHTSTQKDLKWCQNIFWIHADKHMNKIASNH